MLVHLAHLLRPSVCSDLISTDPISVISVMRYRRSSFHSFTRISHQLSRTPRPSTPIGASTATIRAHCSRRASLSKYGEKTISVNFALRYSSPGCDTQKLPQHNRMIVVGHLTGNITTGGDKKQEKMISAWSE
jgi:hypothetical protein